jgi:hypothetical protein
VFAVQEELDEAHWIAKIYAALNEKEQAFFMAGTWLSNGSDRSLL